MTINALFFAHYQDIAGASAKAISIPEGATVTEMLAILSQEYPALDAALIHGRIAVNLEFADGARVLADGDEVALMPPMSGGRF